jgi:SpoIID/LytB domain protein
MQIRVGITASDLVARVHKQVALHAQSKLVLSEWQASTSASPLKSWEIPGSTRILVESTADGDGLVLTAGSLKVRSANVLKVKPDGNSPITVTSIGRDHGGAKIAPGYVGQIELSTKNKRIQIILECDLEDYIHGVLGSEIPASYALEAIKAQAVAARTYGLRPRINHEPEGFNVCDSWLCCQYFAGTTCSISPKHKQAIEETRRQILTWNSKPILALFSACAGGHTESYENCFSDPVTNQFPPAPLPYLKGVAEGVLPQTYPSEKALRQLYQIKNPDTCDGWSSMFRWHVSLSANQLEGHMHHVVEKMLGEADTKPFILPASSGKFGHIEKFAVPQRGVAGTAITLNVHTSTGIWTIKKELVIRSAFANPEIKLTRLKSARLFFDHEYDKLGLLSNLKVYGFGWGHGVGMQQHGAQGLALLHKNYKQILAHYFTGAQIATL